MSKPGYRRRFTLEVTLAELRAMRAAAGDVGMTTSAWLRSAMRDAIAKADRLTAKKARDERLRSE
jgi:hypothetical protein